MNLKAPLLLVGHMRCAGASATCTCLKEVREKALLTLPVSSFRVVAELDRRRSDPRSLTTENMRWYRRTQLPPRYRQPSAMSPLDGTHSRVSGESTPQSILTLDAIDCLIYPTRPNLEMSVAPQRRGLVTLSVNT